MLTALVVEDEVALQELYGRILEGAGYDVHYAGDGQIAIDMLKNNPAPRLIVLDIRMPNLNGLEVLEYLQSYPGVENIHVLIASASHVLKEYVDMLPSSEFLLKPVMPTHLYHIISNLGNLQIH